MAAQNIFNLYSSSVFADHPLALWNLDDDFSYLSLISACPVWTIVGGSSASVANDPKTRPGETVGVSDAELELYTFANSSSVMTMKTQTFNSPGNIDINKKTACVSAFLYPYTSDITSCEIGFEYTDPVTSTLVKDYKTYSSITLDEWEKISHTTDIALWSASAANVAIYPYLKLNFSASASNQKFSLYNFSVGQWSEQYNAETVGSTVTPISSLSGSAGIIRSIGGAYSASPSNFKTSEIDAYSLSDQDNGYYIVEGNRMLALNSKLPMVYGSGNVTEIYPSDYGTPSIIIPGKGFFHSSGRYRQSTLEFWMRVNVKTKTQTKILGPISNSDGLYVHDGFLTLKLGAYEKSYFVSKWYTPMLIDITYSQNSVSLMINGDSVIQMTIDINNIEFPTNGLFNTDWLGFYATTDTQPFEIDCIAVYPYIVQDALAKRRFVLAQGVGRSDDIVKRFGGSLFNIDFAFANYKNNLIYPDLNSWESGFYSNVDADSKFLSLPQYSLPEIKYIGEDLQIFNPGRVRRSWEGIKSGGSLWSKWLSTIWKSLALARESDPLYDSWFKQVDSYPVKHLYLRPNSSYDNVYGSIVFPSLGVIDEPTSSILGVFSINSSEIAIANDDPDIQELTVMYFKNRATGDVFKIYIDPSSSKLIYKFNTTVLTEFTLSITSSDLFFIAGININQFSAAYANTIKRFFSNAQNINFTVGGNAKDMFTGKIYKVTINNAFFTQIDMDSWFNDNGVASISNVPTTTFNSAVVKYVGNYTLLFKQTNLSMIMDIGSRGYWEDSIPLSALAGYAKDAKGALSIYDIDMIQFNIDYPSNIYTTDTIDAQDDAVSCFITLKTSSDVSTVNYSNYTIIKELTTERIIDFDAVTTNIDITKFRVVDGTVMFSPKSLIDFKDAYITIHVEFKTDGVFTQKTRINQLSLASLVYDESSLYAINTTTGNKMYPFSRQDKIYTNKVKNPFVIYKKSMPYLFLTGDSGIYSLPYATVDNVINPKFNRGISLAVNASKQSTYNLYGFHLWACYKRDDVFPTTKKIMTLRSNTLTLVFYLTSSDDGKRAKLSVKRITVTGEEDYSNILLYQNGILLDSPYIYPMSWSLLTFSFIQPISFDNYVGQIEVHEGLLFNNATLYEQSIDKRVDDIFESHLGLSNLVAQDDSILYINSEDLDLYTDIKWTTFIGKPV